jgi:hypothetical protein
MNADGWWATRVPGGWEFEISARIKNAGFNSYCPEYISRRRKWTKRGYIFTTGKFPLLANYIFIARDDAFRKQKFETAKIRLRIFREKLVSDAELTTINEVAMAQSIAQAKGHPAKIDRNAIVELEHALLSGKRARVMEVGRRIKVQLLSGGLPFEVEREAVGRVIA